MKLNCKPGVLAFWKSGGPNAGRIVKIGRAAVDGESVESKCGMNLKLLVCRPTWILEEGYLFEGIGNGGVWVQVGADENLVPFKDPGDLEDESTEVRKPKEVAA